MEPPPQYYAQQQQPAMAPTFVTTTTTDRDPQLDARQITRTQGMARTLAGFAVVGILLGVSIFLLDVVPMGSGVRVYQGTYSTSSRYDYTITNYNFFPGVWYGLLNMAACIGVLVYSWNVLKGSQGDADYIIRESNARTWGALLSTLFGVMAAAGIAAIACAAITTATLGQYSLSYTYTCKYLSQPSVCVCSATEEPFGVDYYVQGVDSCTYTGGPLFHIYQAVTAMSAFLVVIDIVISALFCGALCCCVVHAPYYSMGGQQQVVVTSTPGVYVQQQPMQVSVPQVQVVGY